MRGLMAIDVQEALIQRRREEQLILLQARQHPMCARVMKAGAVDFFRSIRNAELLQCIGRALMRSADQRQLRRRKRQGSAPSRSIHTA